MDRAALRMATSSSGDVLCNADATPGLFQGVPGTGRELEIASPSCGPRDLRSQTRRFRRCVWLRAERAPYDAEPRRCGEKIAVARAEVPGRAVAA